MAVAVVGASGYVGRLLVGRLTQLGHRVVAIARSVEQGPVAAGVDRRAVDVADTAAVAQALVGVSAAYYLVHALAGGPDFAERDRAAARSFATAARDAGVRRVVYLGGLGGGGADDHGVRGDPGALSRHLSSRHEVGDLLRGSGIPVVELQAAVVLGAGSISFEMLRYLTERLPAMVCPRWVDTRLQPIAERDLLEYLVRAPDVPGGIYEIGTPDVTTYQEMMQRYAAIRGLPPRRIVKVPLLTPSLSAHWVDAVTPVDRRISHALIESLATEVVVRRPGAAAVFGIEPMPVADAIKAALDEQGADLEQRLFDIDEGLADGVFVVRTVATITPGDAEAVRQDLFDIGGDLSWYGVPGAWRLRLAAGRLFGEHLVLHRPPQLSAGATVDWWTVAHVDAGSVVLSTKTWTFGDAWLGYRVTAGTGPARPDALLQVAAFRPRGALGLAYWRLLWPVHRVVFVLMARRRVRGRKR